MTIDTATARTALAILHLKACLERRVNNAYQHRLVGHSHAWSLRRRAHNPDVAAWLSDHLQILSTIGAHLENLAWIAETASGLRDNQSNLSPAEDLLRECARALPHLERLAAIEPVVPRDRYLGDEAVHDAFDELVHAVRRASIPAFQPVEP